MNINTNAPRLQTLWNYIEEYLEIDYGYLPEKDMNDKDDSCVDEYIQEIKDDFEKMRENGQIKLDAIQTSIDILKKLDDI